MQAGSPDNDCSVNSACGSKRENTFPGIWYCCLSLTPAMMSQVGNTKQEYQCIPMLNAAFNTIIKG